MSLLTRWPAVMMLFMAACASHAPGGDNRSPDATYVYECADGYRFVAAEKDTRLWLFLPGETLELLRHESAGPAVYVNGQTEFRQGGNHASLDYAGASHAGCQNNRAAAIWEHAKLNGADFRAVGNEPGWTLLITEGASLVLVTAYGSETYAFDTPPPVSDPELRRSEYSAIKGGHEISVVLEGRECRDTMSGESFETTVTVIIDETSLNGCGRALH